MGVTVPVLEVNMEEVGFFVQVTAEQIGEVRFGINVRRGSLLGFR